MCEEIKKNEKTVIDMQHLHRSNASLGIIPTTFRNIAIKLVFARQNASTDRVVSIESNVEMFEAGEQLWDDGAADGIVVALIDCGKDVSVLLAELVDECYVPGRVV